MAGPLRSSPARQTIFIDEQICGSGDPVFGCHRVQYADDFVWHGQYCELVPFYEAPHAYAPTLPVRDTDLVCLTATQP